MTDKQKLSSHEKKVLSGLLKPGVKLLFNIKGMIQLVADDGSFTFIEMGRSLIEDLDSKGLITTERSHSESHVLQGEVWKLTEKGKEAAQTLVRDNKG